MTCFGWSKLPFELHFSASRESREAVGRDGGEKETLPRVGNGNSDRDWPTIGQGGGRNWNVIIKRQPAG